jgi:uncharacterized membrane protein
MLAMNGRIYHMLVVAPYDYAVPHPRSPSVLVGGLVGSSLATVMVVALLVMLYQYRQHVRITAARHAHELTVSYAAHEIRST